MTIRPRDLPKRRNQILKHIDDPAGPLRARTSIDRVGFGLDAMDRHLRAADLYWIATPMAALAMSAGARLDAIDAAPHTRPSEHGLVVFDGGIGDFRFPHGWLGPAARDRPRRVPLSSLPVAALSWGPHDGGVLVSMYADRKELSAHLAEHGGEFTAADMPPLVPMMGTVVPTTPMDSDNVPLGAGPVLRCLVASWLLMQQPQYADREQVRPDRLTCEVTRRLGMPAPEVTVVDLRRRYRPDEWEEIGVEGGRRYRYRQTVVGHWRAQPYGPGRALRRRQWIEEYERGPDGAPLLKTERVNVWRR